MKTKTKIRPPAPPPPGPSNPPRPPRNREVDRRIRAPRIDENPDTIGNDPSIRISRALSFIEQVRDGIALLPAGRPGGDLDRAIMHLRIARHILSGDLDRMCSRCGCTDSHACEGGCHWAVIYINDPFTGICNRCVEPTKTK